MKKVENIGDRLEEYLYFHQISKKEWLKILNVIETYSGIKSVKEFAEENKISVQAAYRKEVFDFKGIKLIFKQK